MKRSRKIRRKNNDPECSYHRGYNIHAFVHGHGRAARREAPRGVSPQLTAGDSEKYFKSHERIPTTPLSIRMVIVKPIGIIIFTALLTGLLVMLIK